MKEKDFNIYKYIGVQTGSVTVKELVGKYHNVQQQNKQLQEKLDKANNKLKDIKQGLLQTKNQNLYVSPNIFLYILESESE